MGCDGYILNPFEPLEYRVRCYQCGGWIDYQEPSVGHTDCIDAEGRLRVNEDYENYERR